jgi:hypothetical protein
MNNKERGEPIPRMDKKFEFSKSLLCSITIIVCIVLIGTILGTIFKIPIDFSAILPWTISIYAIATPYIKDKQ